MKFRIGTVDGNVHETMNVSEEELLEELRAARGSIGSGRFSDVRVHTIEDTDEQYRLTYAEVCELGREPQLFGGKAVDEHELSRWKSLRSWA